MTYEGEQAICQVPMELLVPPYLGSCVGGIHFKSDSI